MNIVDPILFHCRSQPEAPALSVPGFPVVPYGRLGAMLNNAMRAAASRGLARGNTVAILVADPRLHAVLILSLARLGIVTMSLGDPRIPDGVRIDAVLSGTNRPVPGVSRVHFADFTWAMGDGKPLEEIEPYQANAEDVCHIILTSGTTGDPKAVAFTHRMVAERILRHLTVFGSHLSSCSRTFVDMGLGTSLGYMFLIDTLSRGGTLFIGSALDEAVDALELFRVQNLVGSPASLKKFLGAYETSTRKCNLEMMLSAGSPLSASLFERVRARMCENVVSVYGSTETSMVATAPAHLIAATPGAVGYVTPGVAVEAVDEQDHPVPSGREGVIRIRGPYNATEYLGDPAESAKAFRNGWFYPGDFGCVTADELLIVTGREKNVINVGGDKTRPELVEDALTSFGGIEQAGVFAVVNPFGIEEIWAIVVSPSDLDEQRLRAHCERRLLAQFVPARFIKADNLPRNEMGKIDRQRLPDLARTAGRQVLPQAI